jgi:formylglycine-generating enzyme required for sulfatase activity
MPVINTSWGDAKQYVAWLSQLTGKAYRLLTEAEWEYATPAGADTRYSWGNDPHAGNANCDGCRSPWDVKHTAPVGSLKPNAFGLHDMHGNVWEWSRIPGTRTTTVLQRTDQHGRMATQAIASFVVAPGVTRPSRSARPSASGAISMSSLRLSASAWLER